MSKEDEENLEFRMDDQKTTNPITTTGTLQGKTEKYIKFWVQNDY